MAVVKLVQIGDSVGVVLPKETLARLRLTKGDTVLVTEAPNGVNLTPFDSTLEKQLELGREFMRDHSDAFRGLAK
jgi:putative addiction module antidote